MSTRRLLMEQGHDVRVFAMHHPDNIDIPDTAWYAKEVAFSGGLKQKIEGASRIFGFGNIKESVQKVLDDFRPDVVHLHNVHSYLSPLIGEMAAARGIRVVWTLHDYKLLCPSYSCRRPDGNICEECIHSDFKVIRYRCMKGSRIQSLLADIEARYWNRKRLSDNTERFIAPSHFMRNKMLEGGFPHHKVSVLHNFIDPAKAEQLGENADRKREDYFCYVGRLSEEKGVETMLKSAASSGVTLKIAGAGPLLDELKSQYSRHQNIIFLGHLDAQGVIDLLSSAKGSIIPSECYENNPLSAIESLCSGTPVIGASIGGIPELIDSRSGILFTPGNIEELAGILRGFDKRHPFNHKEISLSAREKFSRRNHYDALIRIYNGEEI